MLELVVFAPVAFMGGMVGRFFSCFGYVVGFSVLMSMGVSFTMTPMLCAKFLKLERGHASKGGFLWRMIEGGYRHLPVVHDGLPQGILSVKRIVHYLVEHFPGTVYNLPPDPGMVHHEREGA